MIWERLEHMGFKESHPLGTTETGKMHRPYAPLWHEEGLTFDIRKDCTYRERQ